MQKQPISPASARAWFLQGLVKKMYGQGVFSDEVLRKVEAELNAYMNKEQLEIFAQPLPLDNDARNWT
jgi:trigger factor